MNSNRLFSIVVVLCLQALWGLAFPVETLAKIRPPVAVTISSSGSLEIDRPLPVHVVIEPLKDFASAEFQLLIPEPGWRLAEGQTSWSGPLKAGEVVRFNLVVIPREPAPAPLRGRLGVAEGESTEWVMDMSRLGGQTPEKGVQSDRGGRGEPVIAEPEPRPEWEHALPVPAPESAREPQDPGQENVGKEAAAAARSAGEADAATAAATVTGRFVFGDDMGRTVGVRNATVELFDRDTFIDEHCATGLTDVNGNFSLSGACGDLLGDLPDYYVRISLNSSAVEVKPNNYFAGTFTFQTAVTNDFPGGTLSLGLITVNSAGAYQIYNLAIQSWQHMTQQGTYLPKVLVEWTAGSSAYVPGAWPTVPRIYIQSGHEFLENIVMHEYGHHVLFSIYSLTGVLGPIPNYNNGVCDPSHCLWDPELGNLSWLEGWPDFFSAVLTRAYGHDNHFFVETHLHTSPNTGLSWPGQEDMIEGFIAAILWDLHDATADDDHNDGAGRRDAPGTALTFKQLWDVVLYFDPSPSDPLHNHPTNIHEFYLGVKARLGGWTNYVVEVYREHHIPKPQPDLTVAAISSSPSQVMRGDSVVVNTQVRNTGSEPTVALSVVRYYLHDLLSNSPATLLSGSHAVSNLSAFASTSDTITLTIPAWVAPSLYAIKACADDLSAVPESDEANNCPLSAFVGVVPRADLVTTALADPGGLMFVGSSFSATDTVQNLGPDTAGASVQSYYLEPVVTVISTGPLPLYPLIGNRSVGPLAAGATSTGTVTLTIPSDIAPGKYRLVTYADTANAVAEPNELNNYGYSTNTITVWGSVNRQPAAWP